MGTPESFPSHDSLGRELLGLVNVVTWDGASGGLGDRAEVVGPAGGTTGLAGDGLVRPEDVGIAGDIGIAFFAFERPNGFGTDDGFKVTDASGSLGVFARFDEVWDGHRGEQADDGNDDHDFNQRKPGPTGKMSLHNNSFPSDGFHEKTEF